MASSSSNKTILLKSSDEEMFEVSEKTAMKSMTIKNLLMEEDADYTKQAVPLLNVSSRVLAKVLEYCKRHENDNGFLVGEPKKELDLFDKEFIDVEQPMLFDIIMAANYLDIKPLLDLGCQTVANMMKGKSVQQIRTIFNIKNDYTPEEEQEIMEYNRWAFDR